MKNLDVCCKRKPMLVFFSLDDDFAIDEEKELESNWCKK